MSVEVERIPAIQLSLADMVFDDHTGLQRWVRVVGLAIDSDHVQVMCEGDDQPLRIPAGALVAARRVAHPAAHGDDSDMHDRMSAWYPGDVDSASAAVAAHAQEPARAPDGQPAYPNAHYEGLYGGDLDHVVDAVGGVPDADTRIRRDQATRRHLTQAQRALADAGLPVEEDDDDSLGRFGEVGYFGESKDR
jgi:hypothetical protein